MDLLHQIRALFDGAELNPARDDAFDLQDGGTSDEHLTGQMLARAEVIELLGAASDEEILAAYQTTGTLNPGEADLLASECEHRNIDLFVRTSPEVERSI